MNYLKILFLVNTILIINNSLQAKNNFLNEGKILFENEKYSEAKFKFEKEIVYNPKNENAYLYLAKIFNKEKKNNLEENNLNTVLLLNPKNEEAIYFLTLLKINKSNFSQAKELISNFNSICEKLCSRGSELEDKLINSLK
jgi:tetratricopeptide (TPR) repeat protein